MKKNIKLAKENLYFIIDECYNEIKRKMEIEHCKKEKPAMNENEDVLKLYYNITYDDPKKPYLVEGITIDRIMKKYGKNGYVIVSAYRTTNTKEENIKNTKELISKIKNTDFSYLPTYGGYIEDGKLPSLEPSFIVFNYDEFGNSTDFKKLENFAIDMCQSYKQRSVLIKKPGESPVYVDKNGSIVSKNSSKKYIKNSNKIPYFTSLNGEEKTKENIKNTGKFSRSWVNDINFNDDSILDMDKNNPIFYSESKIYVNPYPQSINERISRRKEIFVL